MRFKKSFVCSWLFQTRICEEYSDPFDLKKVIEQNEDVSETVLSAPADDVPLDSVIDQDQLLKCEDDYSVPYELKERLRGKF